MNTRAQSALLLLLAIASSASCGRPDQPSAANGMRATPGLTPNGDADAGEPSPLADAGELEAGTSDAGFDDAGIEDAGPLCPPFTQVAATGCESEVSVRLTGTAAAIRGDTLFAGTGQQPVLEVFFSGPDGVDPSEVIVAIGSFSASGDAGAAEMKVSGGPTRDDAGTHYDLPWPTEKMAEGSYEARATVMLGDAGFASNALGLLVDRTPPAIDLKVSFDSDATVQPRDFRATATVSAADDGGSGEVAIALSGTGVTMLPALKGIAIRVAAKVDLPADLPLVEGDATTLQTRLYGGDIRYDAWSTAQDNWPIEIHATATDLVGNVASAVVSVPVTRGLWDSLPVRTSGPLSIGAQGQILVNHGLSLDALMPDGTLQSSTKIASARGGSPVLSTGAPETLVWWNAPQGQTFVPSLVTHVPAYSYGQVSSVGPTSTFASITSTAAMAFAVSAGRKLVYALSEDCALGSFDPTTGANETPAGKTNPFSASCSGSQVALGKNHLIAASAAIDLSYALSPLDGDWSWRLLGAQGAPPAFLGNLAVFTLGGDLELFDPSTGPDNDLMGVGIATATKVVTSSAGDVFVLESDGTFTKLSSKGVKSWQRKLGTGFRAPGLAIGAGADFVYAVDGSGTLWAFDADGNLPWKSPQDYVQGDPLIDRCTGHAYASVYGAPTAVAVDSLGLDMGAGAWPVTGHDVFQTYDAEGSADVSCEDHL